LGFRICSFYKFIRDANVTGLGAHFENHQNREFLKGNNVAVLKKIVKVSLTDVGG